METRSVVARDWRWEEDQHKGNLWWNGCVSPVYTDDELADSNTRVRARKHTYTHEYMHAMLIKSDVNFLVLTLKSSCTGYCRYWRLRDMVSLYTFFSVCNLLRIYDYFTIKSYKKSSSLWKFRWHLRKWNPSPYWMSFFPLLFLCFRLFLEVLDELRGFRLWLVILLDFYAYAMWELIVDLFIPPNRTSTKSQGL